MPEKLSNISKKFDEVRKEVLTLINSATIKCSCEFLVVGATARDIILKYCYEITADLRATIDLDVAINVPDWEGFQKIKDVLIETGRFNKDRLEHRIYYEGSSPVDIIPFGGIENTEGKIFFPPENRFEMTTLGFKEALTNARRVIIAEEPQIIVNVASLEHLFIMKLIAWDEKYPERSKDASDMAIILKYYLEGENQQKLYDDDSDILEANDFDFETAAARILGRDISRFSTQKTLKYIGEIFERETNPEKEYRLARALINSTVYDDELEKAILLIDNIRQGIRDL